MRMVQTRSWHFGTLCYGLQVGQRHLQDMGCDWQSINYTTGPIKKYLSRLTCGPNDPVAVDNTVHALEKDASCAVVALHSNHL